MIDNLIDRMNHLCRKLITDEQNFTEGDEIRQVFKKIKDLGFSVYSEPFDKETIVVEYLSDKGKAEYEKLQDVRKRKMDAIANRNFERAADLRDIERELERKVILDYMKTDGVAYLKIKDRDAKEIICYLYCEMLKSFFKVSF